MERKLSADPEVQGRLSACPSNDNHEVLTACESRAWAITTSCIDDYINQHPDLEWEKDTTDIAARD